MKIKVGKTPVIDHIYNTIKGSTSENYIIKSIPNTANGISNFNMSMTTLTYNIFCKTTSLMKTEEAISVINYGIERELKNFLIHTEPLYIEGVEILEYVNQDAKEYIYNMRKIMEWYNLGLFGEVNLKMS